MAQYVVQEILEHLANNSQPDAQVSKERGSSTNSKQPSKRRKQTHQDRTYQPPKPPTKQLETGKDEAEDPNAVIKYHSLVGDDSFTCQPGHGKKSVNRSSDSLITEETRPIQETQPIQKTQSLQECEEDIPEIVGETVPQERVQDQPTIDDSDICPSDQDSKPTNQNENNLTTEEAQPIQKGQSIQETQPSPKVQSLQRSKEYIPETIVEKENVPQEGVQDQPTTDGHTTCTEVAQNLPKPMYSSDNAIRNEAQGQLSVAIDDVTENSQTTCLTSLPSETEQRGTTLPEIDEKASDAQHSSATSPPSPEPYETTLFAPTPSTPVQQTGQQLQSPFSDDQTITPNTTIFTPTVNGGYLSPLTENGRATSSPEQAAITLLDGITSPLSYTGYQQTKLSNTAPIQAQQVNGEQFLRIQNC